MNVFFTSDQHYFHNRIIDHCNRPFTAENMNDELISRFNSKVSKKDITYHLGDFTLGKVDSAISILNKLNGKHFFVKGNHDHWLKDDMKANNILGISYYHEIKDNGDFIVMSHYPMLSWNRSYHGSFMLHGHCHSKSNYLNTQVRRLDVGVDSAKLILGDYIPFSLDEVRNLLTQNNF